MSFSEGPKVKEADMSREDKELEQRARQLYVYYRVDMYVLGRADPPSWECLTGLGKAPFLNAARDEKRRQLSGTAPEERT